MPSTVATCSRTLGSTRQPESTAAPTSRRPSVHRLPPSPPASAQRTPAAASAVASHIVPDTPIDTPNSAGSVGATRRPCRSTGATAVRPYGTCPGGYTVNETSWRWQRATTSGICGPVLRDRWSCSPTRHSEPSSPSGQRDGSTPCSVPDPSRSYAACTNGRAKTGCPRYASMAFYGRAGPFQLVARHDREARGCNRGLRSFWSTVSSVGSLHGCPARVSYVATRTSDPRHWACNVTTHRDVFKLPGV